MKYNYNINNSNSTLQIDMGTGFLALPHGKSVIVDNKQLVDMLCKIRGVTLTSVDKIIKKTKKVEEEMQ